MKTSRGFTLIELMVGVALGLLATVVIAQVFLQSEGNKRSTTGGADAQVSGALALFTLQRDIGMAGYGLAGLPGALGCPVTGRRSGTAVAGFQGAADPLVPVLITAGTGSASDAVSIWSSGKLSYSVPMKLTEAHDIASTSFVVKSTMGVAAGDLLVAIPPAWQTDGGCTVVAATSSSLDSSTVVSHDAAANVWNVGGPGSYAADSVLLNLGPAPLRRTYSINTTTWSLQVADFLAGSIANSSSSQFPNIVLLKALYGKSNTPTGVVATYDAVTPTTPEGWQAVGAVRIVVVARSGQYEIDNATDHYPEWEAGPLVAGTSACKLNPSGRCLSLDVSASGNNDVTDSKGTVDKAWKHYRYKVFDTVVPLRNMLWLSGSAS